MRCFFLFLLTLIAPLNSVFAKPIIIIDPGHGGKDQGAKIRAFEEKKLTLKTSYLTKKHLEALGYHVVLTRARDIFTPLQTRVLRANKREDALFISIHYNASKSPIASGIEVYYPKAAEGKRKDLSKALASAILRGVLQETAAESRGIKQGNFQVIRETVMPAILIEGGFLTNLEERRQLGTQGYLDKLARGIAIGVDKYLKGK